MDINLGEFVETLCLRRTGSVAYVHVECLAASWANEVRRLEAGRRLVPGVTTLGLLIAVLVERHPSRSSRQSATHIATASTMAMASYMTMVSEGRVNR